MEYNYDELIKKIDELQSENKQLIEWQKGVTELLQKVLGSEERHEEAIKILQNYSFVNRIRLESMPYELRDQNFVSKVFVPRIMSIDETREAVTNMGKSIGRFGDGEFAAICGIKRWNFQGISEYLGNRLREVLASKDDGFLVAINPNFYGNLEDISESDADGVRAYMRPQIRKLHSELLDREKQYGNLLMHRIESEDDVKSLKKLWEGRDCIFVEGQYTRMGVGNDLFSNCKSIKRILCPSENAVDRYEDILGSVTKNSTESLVLIALGPTATVLTYDLFRRGYHAVDIGHIDLLYEKYIRNFKGIEQVDIPYKYCSKDEIGEGREIPDVDDKEYMSQILDRLY